MGLDYEELDFQQTPLGELLLRRRRMRSLDNLEIYEIILGSGYLMSSLFTTVEIALAKLPLEMLQRDQSRQAGLDIVVGGLGLGYTAHAALEDERVHSLVVVEALSHVIGWHQRELVPLGQKISRDPRCRFVEGDFFALCGAGGFDPDTPNRRFHAILLDIDHSPENLIHENHRPFYTPDGLRKLATHLHPGGIFAMWSDDPPDADFEDLLRRAFVDVTTHVVTFPNPLLDRDSQSTIYLARRES